MKKKNDEMNFWQPATDMMTGLLFVLLLIIMLLMLYILNLPQKKEDHKYETNHQENTETDATESTGSTRRRRNSDGGGDQEEQTTEEKIPTSGGGREDEGMKAAVYAVIIDAETKKTIEKKDVAFELYENDKSLQTLYTYYPEKIGYKKFQTTDKGVFYLPEKIREGNYFFRQLTDVDGYNKSGDTAFEIDKLYDWPDPFVVKIPMYPASSIIYLEMQDGESGQSIPEGEFRIVAAEDIITKDGTIRYKAGDKVGKIKINEKGEGESKKLYLGKYTLTEVKIPQQYAGIENDISVTVEKEMKKENATVVKNDKTTLTVSLADELYPEQTLADIPFTMTDEEGNKQSFNTDQEGHFTVSDLKKDTQYTLSQDTLAKGYFSKSTDYTFTVDKKGHIEKSPFKNVTFTNRKIRTSFQIRDQVLGSIVKNMNIALEKDGKEIESWTSQGQNIELESLEPGQYMLKAGRSEFPVIIKDTSSIQEFNFKVMTTKSIVVIILSCMALAFLLAGIIKLVQLVRKRRNR